MLLHSFVKQIVNLCPDEFVVYVSGQSLYININHVCGTYMDYSIAVVVIYIENICTYRHQVDSVDLLPFTGLVVLCTRVTVICIVPF